MAPRIGTPPDAEVLEALALDVFARIPEPFAAHLAGVLVRVEDFADEETLAALGIEDAWELTGLYHGRPFGEEWQTGDLPSAITLYRQPLLAEWVETGVGLEELVAHVVIHEVGHHFGLTDAQMDALEAATG